MERPEKRALPDLPDDPLVEILSRVSVKDLHRAKCVSKGWRDLIADPIHRKKLPKTLEGFLYGGTEESWRYIDLMNRSVPLVDPSISFVARMLGTANPRLLHSCNGLLLFLVYGCTPDTYSYVVCNPATEQLVAVPVPPSPSEDVREQVLSEKSFFLMFDPAVSSHFHLIKYFSSLDLGVVSVHVFSSETGAWIDRASEWKAGEEGGEWAQWGEYTTISWFSGHTVFNNMLHFIARGFCFVPGLANKIVAVDGQGKTCRVMPWLEDFSFPTFIGQSQGRLFCSSERVAKACELSIWVLEDYATEEWCLKHKVSFLKLFGKVTCLVHFDYSVVAIHPDRNLIFLYYFRDQKLISYDMESEKVCALCTLGHNDDLVTPYIPCFSELPLLTHNK